MLGLSDINSNSERFGILRDLETVLLKTDRHYELYFSTLSTTLSQVPSNIVCYRTYNYILTC
jgi:hypothetical protein